MDWSCDCCGDTVKDCDHPNRPGPWDKCHAQRSYRCPICGRRYKIHHGDGVSANGQPCAGPDCGGSIVRVTFPGSRRFHPN